MTTHLQGARKQSAQDSGTHSLVEAVQPYLAEIRASARETELAREQLPKTVELVKRLGIVRALVPRSYGGLEHDTFDWLQSLRALASADMSAAWFAGLASAHSFALTKFDKRVQDEIWGGIGPDAVISSATAVADGGVAKLDGDGIRLSGRWRFSSGVTAADWTMFFIKVPNATSGEIEPYWALLPKSDYSVVDTWHTSGMRGTGSHDAVLEDVFVPRHRLGGPGLAVEPEGGALYDNPLFAVPFLVIYPIIFAPVALGGVEGAVQLHTEALRTRKAALSGVPLIESPIAHVRLAEAAMRARAIGCVMESRWRALADHIAEARPIDPQLQMLWRVDDAYVGREAMRIVEHIIEGSGASVYFDANPLQRFWRDLHATGGHTHFNTDSAMQILGRSMLGLPADPRLI